MISLLKVYRAVQEHYQACIHWLIVERAHAKTNGQGWKKRWELSGMILLRSHRVMLITLIFIYNSIETRQIGCRYIIRNIRLSYSKSFVQRGGIFPRCLHRGKFRFFNLGYVHERTVSEDVSTAMVAPSLQEVGNQTTFVHARIGDFAEANVGFIPLYKAIHKISKRPPCTLPPPPWNTSRISRSRLWSISH